jgi:hypothetical protein
MIVITNPCCCISADTPCPEAPELVTPTPGEQPGPFTCSYNLGSGPDYAGLLPTAEVTFTATDIFGAGPGTTHTVSVPMRKATCLEIHGSGVVWRFTGHTTVTTGSDTTDVYIYVYHNENSSSVSAQASAPGYGSGSHGVWLNYGGTTDSFAPGVRVENRWASWTKSEYGGLNGGGYNVTIPTNEGPYKWMRLQKCDGTSGTSTHATAYIPGAAVDDVFQDSVTFTMFKVVCLYAAVEPCDCYFGAGGGTTDECYETYPGPGVLEAVPDPARSWPSDSWPCYWKLSTSPAGAVTFLSGYFYNCTNHLDPDYTEKVVVRYWFSRKAADFETSGLYTACCEIQEEANLSDVTGVASCAGLTHHDTNSMGGVVRPLSLEFHLHPSGDLFNFHKRYKFQKCGDPGTAFVLVRQDGPGFTPETWAAGDIGQWTGANGILDGYYECLGITAEDIYTCTNPVKIYGVKLTHCETLVETHYKATIDQIGFFNGFFWELRPDGVIVRIGEDCYTLNYEALTCSGAATLPSIGTIEAAFDTCEDCTARYYTFTECGFGPVYNVKLGASLPDGTIVRTAELDGLFQKCYSIVEIPEPFSWTLVTTYTVIPEGCESGECLGWIFTPCPNSVAAGADPFPKTVVSDEALLSGDVVRVQFPGDARIYCYTVTVGTGDLMGAVALPAEYSLTSCGATNCPRVFELVPCDTLPNDTVTRYFWTVDPTMADGVVLFDYGFGLTNYTATVQPSSTFAVDGELPAWITGVCI